MTLTAQQLEMRRGGIGSSEIAAIIGKNRFSSPMAVFLSKTENVDQETTTAMQGGNFFEASIAKWYASREGVRLSAVPPTLVHPDHPWMMASIDRFAVMGRARKPYRVVEIKHVTSSASFEEWGVEGTDEAPVAYLIQVAWQLEVAYAHYGVEEAHLVPSFFGREPHVYPVRRDPELGAALIEAGSKFWHEHVVPRVPPPIDGSEASQRYLKRAFPTSNGEIKSASVDSMKWFRQYGRAAAAARLAEREKKEAQAFLKLEIGANGGIEGPLGRATWSGTRGKVDWEAYARKLGATDEAAEAYRKPDRVMRVKLEDDDSED